MKINLLTPSGFTLPLNNVKTIDDIKAIINFITGTSTARLCFICAGKLLDHVTSLADQNIRNGSIIYVFEVGFQIFVRNFSGKTITIDNLHSYDTVEHVMNLIEKKDGVPYWYQQLVHVGKQLVEEMTLADYGIQKESTLFMVSRLRSYHGLEDWFHNLPEEVTLAVKTSDTIGLVKRKIMTQIFHGGRPDRLLLAFNGKVLDDDNSTLMDNNIQVGSIINLKLAPPPWVRISERGTNEEEGEDAEKTVSKQIQLTCEIEEENEWENYS